jgi:hypothetical protein
MGKHASEWEVRMKRLVSCAIPIVLLTAGSTPGAAERLSLPNWQIGDICAKDSVPGQCAAFEAEALRTVSATWAFVADPIKQTCFAQLSSPADRSWRLLGECIDAEALKARDRAAVKTAKTPGEVMPPRLPPAAKSPTSISPAETPKTQ